jgi:hypothetical protein
MIIIITMILGKIAETRKIRIYDTHHTLAQTCLSEL